MHKIDIKIFIRLLLKRKSDAMILLIGLVMGISSLIVISLLVITEISYDRFHKDSDRIYRVEMSYLNRDGKETKSPMLSPLHADYLRSSIPGVEKVTRLFTYTWKEEALIEYSDKEYFESNVFFIDESFFDMFSYELIMGSKESLFNIENAVVLSQECARKYFGDEDPLGQLIYLKNFGNIPLVVSGVMRTAGYYSHFHSDILIPLPLGNKVFWENFLTSWFSNNFYTYIKINKGADPDQILDNINTILASVRDEHLGDQKYSLMPIHQIHLFSKHTSDIEPGGNIRQLYFSIIIGILIGIITLSNYSSITSSVVYFRAREVGIKKLLGKGFQSLFLQMLIESAIINFIAFVCALMLVELLSPFIGLYLNVDLRINFILRSFPKLLLLFYLAFCLLAALLPAGIYSSYQVMEVLKGHFRRSSLVFIMRKAIIIIQVFLVSLVLTGAIIISLQQRFLLNKNRGLALDNIIVVPLKDYQSINKYEEFKNKLLSHPEILNVSASTSLPINTTAVLDVVCEGHEDTKMVAMNVDFGFVELYGMEIISGRSFDASYSTDDEAAYIINETAAASLGWETFPARFIHYSNKGLKYPEFIQGKVIGIVRDFNHTSMHSEIQPLIMKIGEQLKYVSIKHYMENNNLVYNIIKESYEEVYGQSEPEYYTAKNKYAEIYSNEHKLSKLFSLSTIFVLAVMWISVIALVRFDIRRKYKEIGIRKIFGAGIKEFLLEYIWKYALLFSLSYLASIPVSFIILKEWLSLFSYSIKISPFLFISSLLILNIISLPFVAVSVYTADRHRPLLNFRYE